MGILIKTHITVLYMCFPKCHSLQWALVDSHQVGTLLFIFPIQIQRHVQTLLVKLLHRSKWITRWGQQNMFFRIRQDTC